VFTDDEMNAPGPLPPARIEALKGRVGRACASKIPEDVVKDGFQATCGGGGQNSEMKAYCDCSWTEYRKLFSLVDLSDDSFVESDRFRNGRTKVVKVCANKMPESVSQAAFMRGCVKSSSTEAFCNCAWKEVRKLANPAEIQAGTFDQKRVFSQIDAGCAKLRPPNK
jgi:hypothetical protein